MKKLVFEEDPEGEYAYVADLNHMAVSVLTKGCTCDECNSAPHYRLVEEGNQWLFRLAGKKWDVTMERMTETRFLKAWPGVREYKKLECL